MNHTSVRRLKLLSVAAAVVAGLVCLAFLGMERPAAPFAAFDLVGPVIADSNGNHTAIVDSGSRRVLILNKEHRLMGMINCEELNSPIETVTNVAITDDTVYVTGAKYQAGSDIIVRERVVSYNLFGTSSTVLDDREIAYGFSPTMMAMDAAEEGVYVTMADYASDNVMSAIEVVYEDIDGPHVVNNMLTNSVEIHDVGYCVSKNTLSTVSTRGVLDDDFSQEKSEDPFTAAHLFTSLDMTSDGQVYLYDDATNAVCLLGDGGEVTPIIEGGGYMNPRVTGDTLTVCNVDMDAVVISDLRGNNRVQIDEVMPSKSLGALVLLVYVSRAYLAVFVIATLLLKLRSLVRQGKTAGIGPMFASVVVVSVVSLAIGYTSYGTFQAQQETRAREIDMLADYVSISSESVSESMEAVQSRDVFRTHGDENLDVFEDLNTIQTQVSALSYAASFNGIGIYTTAYALDDQGVYYLFDSSTEHVIGTSVALSQHEQAIEEVFSGVSDGRDIHIGNTRYDTTQYRLVGIYSTDSSKIVGVVEVGSRVKSFEASLAGEQLQRIIALLVMVLVVYLTYVEVRACAVCFFSYQQMRHHHDSIAILTRPFSFFVTLLSSIDAVMTALIARSLIEKSGMDGSSLLLALPAVMLGVGLAIGQAIYAAMGSRVVINKLMMNGALAMLVAAIFTGAVVWSGNFWLYCVAKLFMAVPFGLLYTLSYSLPRRADTDEVRVLAASGIKRTDTSAAALGTVLGGYVAQNLGNAWVYALVAVVSAVVFAMAANMLPATKHPLEEEADAVDSRPQAMGMLLASKTTLPIIFFLMLPSILSAGYNSFVFPLFSADLGLETASINNLFVLGQLVVFVSIGAIEYAEEQFDKWRVSCVAIALLGVVFLLFSFNTTLVWAVVTIALVGVLCKSSDGWKAMWPRSAAANGLPAGMATGTMFSVRSILLIVQPLLLGALLNVSNQTAVVVLGVACLLCALAFWLATRRSALAPTE
ncbi:MAG: MFS transporter [Atopobiaceae bacterium]|nr:MFS transporter [Atopobiaceae bacterium]